MKDLTYMEHIGFPKLISQGTSQEGFVFIIMEKLGFSLRFLRKKFIETRFSLKTVAQVGM